MTIKQLKRVLANALEECESFDDDRKLYLQSNTYFVNGANYFLGVSGFDGGYLDLNKIPEMIRDEEEDYD
jgi:hypothetical protein